MGTPKSWEQYKEELTPLAKNRNIQILGYVGEWKGNKTKLKLSCPKHGEWNTTNISSFRKGRGCPACARNKPLTWETELPILEEIAQKKGYQVLGYVGEWKGNKTKLDLLCHCGYRWQSTAITDFKRGGGCPSCNLDSLRKRIIIPDDQHIQDFMNTGAFQPGTIFINTGERTGNSDSIWCIKCPICSYDEYVQAGVCDGKFYSTKSSLKNGSLACRCSTRYVFSDQQLTYRMRKELQKKDLIFIEWVGKPSVRLGKFKYLCLVHGEQIGSASNLLSHGRGCPMCAGHSQQQLYINIVKDDNIIVALKFGIAKDSDRRLNIQNSRNLFFMERICLYDFSTVKQCKAAERAIKKKLKTGILTARELKDGHTETVSVSDLENLQKIITQYGGKLVYSKEV
ncbi:hypothetical protein sKKP3263_000166 [Serratia phage KKP_3264]|nr:hypothetical protein sKKP3263_000166 [Serratia phage KKP_3264]